MKTIMRASIPLFLAAVISAQAGAPFSQGASRGDYFAKLAEFESGNNDRATGWAGEVSRYQITKANWSRYAKGLSPANPFTALNVASAIMRDRVGLFVLRHDRQPNAYEWYLLWNRPARVDMPRLSERQRAQRFSNLVTKTP